AKEPFNATLAREHQLAWAQYLKIDHEFTNSLGMKFVLIPPGEFIMGSPPDQVEEEVKLSPNDDHWVKSSQSEGPQHHVVLTRPIFLSICEVTQEQYEKVMHDNPSHFSPIGDGRKEIAEMNSANFPVERITWNDAAEFCCLLSQMEKL